MMRIILGNQLAKTFDVDILCGYSLSSVRSGMDSHTFQRLCAEHSAFITGNAQNAIFFFTLMTLTERDFASHLSFNSLTL
jgi:hypothetical protein